MDDDTYRAFAVFMRDEIKARERAATEEPERWRPGPTIVAQVPRRHVDRWPTRSTRARPRPGLEDQELRQGRRPRRRRGVRRRQGHRVRQGVGRGGRRRRRVAGEARHHEVDATTSPGRPTADRREREVHRRALAQTAIADDDLRPAMDNLVRGFGRRGSAEGARPGNRRVRRYRQGSEDRHRGDDESRERSDRGARPARDPDEGRRRQGHVARPDHGDDVATRSKVRRRKAADSAAGKMRGAKVQFGEFQETIGNACCRIGSPASWTPLLPALDSVGNWIPITKVARRVHRPSPPSSVPSPSRAFAAGRRGRLRRARSPPRRRSSPSSRHRRPVAVHLIIHNLVTRSSPSIKVAFDAIVIAVKAVWHGSRPQLADPARASSPGRIGIAVWA